MRYATEEEAWAAARELSKQGKGVAYVVESPSPVDPRRFCVDDDGFVRSWERLCAVFENGAREKRS